MVYRQQLGNLWGLFYRGTSPKPLLPSYFLNSSLVKLSYRGWTFNVCVGMEGSRQGTDTQSRTVIENKDST